MVCGIVYCAGTTDLLFPEYNDYRYKPGLGAAIVFSATLLHEATPVLKGARYVLLTFVHDAEAEARRLTADPDVRQRRSRSRCSCRYVGRPPVPEAYRGGKQLPLCVGSAIPVHHAGQVGANSGRSPTCARRVILSALLFGQKEPARSRGTFRRRITPT